MLRRPRSPPPPAPSPAPPACAAPRAASCSCRSSCFVVHLSGVEGLLQRADPVLLGHGLVVLVIVACLGLARLEDDREPAARHFVQGLAQQAEVLRLRDLLSMEVVAGRKLDRQ